MVCPAHRARCRCIIFQPLKFLAECLYGSGTPLQLSLYILTHLNGPNRVCWPELQQLKVCQVALILCLPFGIQPILSIACGLRVLKDARQRLADRISVLVPAEFLSARPRGTRSVHISDCVPDQFRTEVNLAEHLQWGGDETV